MPRKAPVQARVEPELYQAARRAAGLPVTASQGDVVRFAFAFLVGDRDPHSVTGRRPGPAGRKETIRGNEKASEGAVYAA